MSSTNYMVINQVDNLEEAHEEDEEEVKAMELEEISVLNSEHEKYETHSNIIECLTIKETKQTELGCLCFKPPIHPIMVRKTIYPFNHIVSCFEEIRWRINYFGLFNPFGSFCNNTKYIRYISQITISDIIIFIIFILFEFISLYIECINNINTIITKGKGKQINKDPNNELLRDISLSFGYVSIYNYALTLLFCQRNTILNLIFGLPFERCLIYHKFIAILAILFSWIHFILILFYWNDSNNNSPSIQKQILISHNIYGLISFLCVNIVAIFSFYKIRRKYWELFLKTHWIFIILFLIFACLHHEKFFIKSFIMIITIILLIFDILWRIWLIFGYKKRVTISNIESISNDIIKINLYKNNFIFDGGQYVFLCFPSIDITQWHPFSIANAPNNNGNIILYIKYLGDWTKKLKYLLLNVSNVSNIITLIEGPYGRISIPIYKYSSIILISGGIGITPMKSIFNQLIQYIQIQKTNCINIKRIHFVWSTKKCDNILKEFHNLHWNVIIKYCKYDSNKSLLERENLKFAEEIKVNNVIIKTSYYITRIKNKNEQNKWKKVYMNLHFQRPSAGKLIQEAQNCVGSESIGILGCGPVPMINDIKYQAAFHKIHCHTELFDF